MVVADWRWLLWMVVVAVLMLLLVALDMRSGILDKIVDKNRPGALLVIVRQIVVHGRRKIQQQVPRVLWHKERYSFFSVSQRYGSGSFPFLMRC
jgi:hypothetical protein